jgi:hypothetical protein
MELNPILNLDIGGKRFRVLRETVMKFPSSLLAQVITGKDTFHMLIADGAYFFDRNPQYFSAILDYMRIGKLFLPTSLLADQMKEELVFWKLDSAQFKPATTGRECEPTLVMPDLIEPTLVLSERIEPTVVMEIIEPTVLVPSPAIEPTLLIEDFGGKEKGKVGPSQTENLMKKSIKNFKAFSSTQNEDKTGHCRG